MRTLSIAFFLSACGLQTTQVFSPAPGSSAEDVAMLRAGVDAVNAEAGCELLRLDVEAKPNVHFAVCGGIERVGWENASPFEAPSLCVESTTADGLTPERYHIVTMIALHEMGHAAGLRHVAQGWDIMSPAVPGAFYGDNLARFVEQLRKDAGAQCPK